MTAPRTASRSMVCTLAPVDAAVAQVAALVAQGNAALAGDTEAAARLEAGTTFRHVRSLRFERQEGEPPVTTHVEVRVGGWFRRLPQWGVTALRLDPRPLAVPTLAPHLLAAWVDGSRVSIVTEGAEPRQRWIATSRLGAPRAEGDERLWGVFCFGRPDVANLAAFPSLAEAAARLEDLLRSAAALARHMDESFWADRFDEALTALTENEPRTAHHDDVLPPGADVDRRRLLAAAVRSWVFGGMGTWNDVGPAPGDEAAAAEYDRVTPSLYAAVLDAVAAAVNPS